MNKGAHSGYIGLAVLCLHFALSIASAQTLTDTTRTTPRDSVAAADSLHSAVLAGIGTIREETDTTDWFTTRFIWTDARYLGDLFRLTPGMFLQEPGIAGLLPEITVGGVGARGLSVLLDGHPLNDPVTGTANLYDIPIEFVDHLEFWGGAESFIPCGNGSAGTVNVVTRQYNTGRPVTKIRFMQGPYEHILTDALFTQNIVRSLNLMFGVQRQVTDGRFVNSGFDSWNVRTRLRWNVSDRLNFSLMDFYQRNVTGTNWGVDIDSTRTLRLDPFNEAEAIVFDNPSNDTRTRRDVTLSTIAALFPDTTWSTKAVLAYSTCDRFYHDPTLLNPGSFDRYSWKSTSGMIRQTVRPGPFTVLIGGEFDTRNVNLAFYPASISKTFLAWFGNAEADILQVLKPRVSVRGESYDHAKTFSYGASVTATPVSLIRVSGGYSSFYRFPGFQESNWSSYQYDPASGLNLLEHHRLSTVSISLSAGRALTISATASQRTIKNALVYKSAGTGLSFTAAPTLVIVPELTIRQLQAGLRFAFWDFEARGDGTMTEVKQGSAFDLAQPKFVVTGELFYHSKVLRGALDMKIGARSRYASSYKGERYLPSFGIYEEQNGPAIPSFSTLDLFGVFNIGDAFITITWQNLLDERYYTVYPYPELGRNIKIGLNWIFLD